jgi:hypothetical protein
LFASNAAKLVILLINVAKDIWHFSVPMLEILEVIEVIMIAVVITTVVEVTTIINKINIRTEIINRPCLWYVCENSVKMSARPIMMMIFFDDKIHNQILALEDM